MKLIKPLGARLLVEVIPAVPVENKTASGLVLPDKAHATPPPCFAKVIERGEAVKLPVMIGATVFFAQGSVYGIDPTDTLKLLDEGNVLAVVGE